MREKEREKRERKAKRAAGRLVRGGVEAERDRK